MYCVQFGTVDKSKTHELRRVPVIGCSWSNWSFKHGLVFMFLGMDIHTCELHLGRHTLKSVLSSVCQQICLRLCDYSDSVHHHHKLKVLWLVYILQIKYKVPLSAFCLCIIFVILQIVAKNRLTVNEWIRRKKIKLCFPCLLFLTLICSAKSALDY